MHLAQEKYTSHSSVTYLCKQFLMEGKLSNHWLVEEEESGYWLLTGAAQDHPCAPLFTVVPLAKLLNLSPN